MGPNLEIYGNLLRAPKSIADYDKQYADARINALAEQEAQMNALSARRKMEAEDAAARDAQAVRGVWEEAGGDVEKARGLLYGRGFAGPAMALEKHLAEQRKAAAEAEDRAAQSRERTVKTGTERIQQYRQALDMLQSPEQAAQWIAAQYEDPLTSDIVRSLGPLEGALQRLPRDPQGFQQWRTQAAMGMEKWLADQRAREAQAEAVRRHQATEALTARGQNISAATARRGQDLADARGREANDVNRQLLLQERELKVGALQDKADERERAKQAARDSVATQISVIDKALTHPGRKTATGLSGAIDPRNYLPGTDATNFQAVLDQINGTAFLQAFESLKGGGQITEVEGKKATQAIARLNRAQSDSEFEQSLNDLRAVMAAGYQRLGGQAPPKPAAGGFKYLGVEK